MSLVTDSARRTKDALEEKFFRLLEMDPNDEGFRALYEEVHQAIDIELALADTPE